MTTRDQLNQIIDTVESLEKENQRLIGAVVQREQEVAAAPAKPKLDVNAFVDEVAETFDTAGTSWPNGFWTGLGRVLREHVEHAAAQLPDELMMNALARVERETQRNTRRECAEMVRRRWAQEEYAGMTDDEFAGRMERVK